MGERSEVAAAQEKTSFAEEKKRVAPHMAHHEGLVLRKTPLQDLLVTRVQVPLRRVGHRGA